MAIQDPDKQAYDDEAPHSGALVPQASVAPVAMSMAPPQEKKDVVKGGMDSSGLFHSLRRRWLLALGLGLLLGSGAAVGLYVAFPESSSAMAMFEVSSNPQTIFEDDITQNTDFDTFRKTQMVLIKSSFVLNAALGNPELDGLAFFDGIDEGQKMEFLSDELNVRFPEDSEILQISLTGSVPQEELETIVEAVSDAYYDEVAFKTHRDRLKPIDILRSSERKVSEELRRKTDAYYALVKERGTGDELKSVDPELTILKTNLNELLQQKANLEQATIENELEWQIQKRWLSDPEVFEQQIQDAIDADEQLAYLREAVMQLKLQAGQMQSQFRSGKQMQQFQQQIATYEQQVAQREAELRAALAQEQEERPNIALQQVRTAYELRKQSITAQEGKVKALITQVSEKLREKGEANTDLEMRLAEIESLRALQASMSERIQLWVIEAESPERVKRIQGIEKTPGINRSQRIAISGVGGLATFALTCFGIAYMEFRNRKLNDADQVNEGLGIRVIGTLPSLAGRKQLDPNSAVVAQLTESIDSVRTALMHESTTKRRQVVLVTSAAALEGRTTVASQLAASLARAGRRTLLVDGDLRRPALHSLFDVPLEDGLSEVLRAECDVADVVRPTHAEGLWLMTAGYCDADAVHALATDQAQPIFDKLRSEYDFIIIDGAPVLGLSDSLLFGQHCDGAILSVLRDYTNVPKIQQAADLLRGVGIRLIGSVVNGMPIKADRRVTHLQVNGPKSQRKQLEQAGV